MKQKIVIYSDGACKGNPGIGGWGALIKYDDRTQEIFGGDLNTTNNRMELMAVIKALETLPEDQDNLDICIFTDSRYVQQGITTWINTWKHNDWKTSNKKQVKNKDLWIKIDLLYKKYKIDWRWVKGHSGHPDNERADYLANQGITKLY